MFYIHEYNTCNVWMYICDLYSRKCIKHKGKVCCISDEARYQIFYYHPADEGLVDENDCGHVT